MRKRIEETAAAGARTARLRRVLVAGGIALAAACAGMQKSGSGSSSSGAGGDAGSQGSSGSDGGMKGGGGGGAGGW
jgi:hypothetical protein